MSDVSSHLTLEPDTAEGCLSLDELRAWAMDGTIGEAQRKHLDGCDNCKSLGEQLAAFSPSAAARQLLALRGTKPRWGATRVALVVVSGIGLISAAGVGVWGAASILRGQRESAAADRRRVDASERLLTAGKVYEQQLLGRLDRAHHLGGELRDLVEREPPSKSDAHRERLRNLLSELDRVTASGSAMKNSAIFNVVSAAGTNQFMIDAMSIPLSATLSSAKCSSSELSPLVEEIQQRNIDNWTFVFDPTTDDTAVRQAVCATRLLSADHAALVGTNWKATAAAFKQ